jgi:hypothetical protein
MVAATVMIGPSAMLTLLSDMFGASEQDHPASVETATGA